MNRRHLFNLLAGAALAPELLVVPKRTHFLPPRGGWPIGRPVLISNLRPGHILTADDIRAAKLILEHQGSEPPHYVVYRDHVFFMKGPTRVLCLGDMESMDWSIDHAVAI